VDGLGYVWTRACVSLSRPQASWDHELSNVVSVISHLPLHHKSHRQNPRPRPHPAFHFHFHLSLLRAVVLRNDITRTPSISISTSPTDHPDLCRYPRLSISCNNAPILAPNLGCLAPPPPPPFRRPPTTPVRPPGCCCCACACCCCCFCKIRFVRPGCTPAASAEEDVLAGPR
jgi:hypothetical protein